MVKKKDSYEALLNRLDSILSDMENEGLDLEKSMKNYEEGINICNKMFKILNEAETRVKVLTENGEKDFIEGDEWYGYGKAEDRSKYMVRWVI